MNRNFYLLSLCLAVISLMVFATGNTFDWPQTLILIIEAPALYFLTYENIVPNKEEGAYDDDDLARLFLLLALIAIAIVGTLISMFFIKIEIQILVDFWFGVLCLLAIRRIWLSKKYGY